MTDEPHPNPNLPVHPEGPAPSAWRHAPADAPDAEDARAVFKSELPPDLQFDPVPRKAKRSNGFTPERQRTFIAMLAATGSVTTAAKAIGCSQNAVQKLRNSAGAESFAAAWAAATARGARRILDVMVDNAVNGTPEYLYQNGQLVAERRRFSTRAQMWIVSHYLPEMFGVAGGLMHSSGSAAHMARMKKQWAAEWKAEQYAAIRQSSDDVAAIHSKRVNLIREGFRRDLAQDPVKRAAWEILTGPADWSDLSEVPDYPGLPDCSFNQHRPDMIVLQAALDVDTPDLGLVEMAERGDLGPKLQAEALEKKRQRENGQGEG